jgi:hypothetical protein
MKAMAQQSNRFFRFCAAKFGNSKMRMILYFADNVAVTAAIHVIPTSNMYHKAQGSTQRNESKYSEVYLSLLSSIQLRTSRTGS